MIKFELLTRVTMDFDTDIKEEQPEQTIVWVKVDELTGDANPNSQLFNEDDEEYFTHPTTDPLSLSNNDISSASASDVTIKSETVEVKVHVELKKEESVSHLCTLYSANLEDTDEDSEFKSESEEANEVESCARKQKKLNAPSSSSKKKLKGFPCRLCDIAFKTKLGKFHHHETHHLGGADDPEEGTTRLFSKICGKASLNSPSNERLIGGACDDDDRLRKREKKVELTCRFCDFRETKNGHLSCLTHERRAHPEKFIYLCTAANCGVRFVEANELRTCEETHRRDGEWETGNPFFKCFVCKGRFKEQRSLREHFELKHTKGGIKCDECELRFSNTKLVTVHKERTHGKELKNKCPSGEGGPSDSAHRVKHTRPQHGKPEVASSKPLLVVCEFCPKKKFTDQKSLLSHHQLIHKKQRGNTKFQCDLCSNGSFSSAQNLARHRKCFHRNQLNNITNEKLAKVAAKVSDGKVAEIAAKPIT